MIGILIGSGAIFLVIGAFCSLVFNSIMQKVSIMRLSAVCSLLSSVLLIVGPVVNHLDDIKENNITFGDIFSDNDWPFIIIPFCILTFSQGLNGPPSNVIVMEPYPHIAGSISAILTFWRLILPSIVMIVITQIVSKQTYQIASVIICVTMSLMGLLCFLLQFGGPCLSKKKVHLRMTLTNVRKKRILDVSSTTIAHSLLDGSPKHSINPVSQ